MKTKLMRSVVWNTKTLLKIGDLKLERIETQTLVSGICKALNESHRDNPRTTAAIVYFLEDQGLSLRHINCDEVKAAVARKDKILEGITPEDSEKIKTICTSLFRQYVKL